MIKCVCCMNKATRKCLHYSGMDDKYCGEDVCDQCVHEYGDHFTEHNLKAYNHLMIDRMRTIDKISSEKDIIAYKLRCCRLQRENFEKRKILQKGFLDLKND